MIKKFTQRMQKIDTWSKGNLGLRLQQYVADRQSGSRLQQYVANRQSGSS
jgi:hypothetical protein